MSGRDFLLLSVVCLIWGSNFVVAKYVVDGVDGFGGLPPLFFTLLRFVAIAALLAPFLRPIPPRFGLVTAYALTLGALHFGFLYTGADLATPSTVSAVFPAYVPFTTLLSVMFLGERVGWRRGAGIGLTVLGVVVIGLEPGAFTVSIGVLAVLAASLSAAAAAVFNRMLGEALAPLQSQAWVALISIPPMAAFTLWLETDQLASLAAGGVLLWGAIAYTVLAVGIFGHSVFYLILSRNPATIVSPLSLMAAVWGMAFGVALMGDPVTWRLVAGGALTIAGAFIVARRRPGRGGLSPATGASAR